MNVILWPDPRLKVPVPEMSAEQLADPELRGIAEQMYATMMLEGGIGLAANQVGLPQRMLVLDVGQGMEWYLNPKVDWVSDFRPVQEGCLSLPGFVTGMQRGYNLTVEHQSCAGTTMTGEVCGLRAHVLQHEIEHLDGKFFLDRVDAATRDRARAFSRKLRHSR